MPRTTEAKGNDHERIQRNGIAASGLNAERTRMT